MNPAVQRIWIAEVELSGPAHVAGVWRAQRSDDPSARVLVRFDHQLLGFVTLSLSGRALDFEAVAEATHDQLAEPLARHLAAKALASRASADRRVGDQREEFISVVVCTRDRPESLATCLERLGHLRYASFEVVVVDNAPTGSATADCFDRVVGADPRFRYVLEPAPGLSKARNRGLREARAARVAFTDDDVRVDPWWLAGISAGFARDPAAGCVTGLAPAAELDDASQQYFDRRYGWASHLESRVFDLAQRRDSSPLYPYSAGLFGTGANFAVDRDLLLRLGGFDEALGAGSPAGGGEDLDAFVRVLHAGRTLVYDPSAIVWHVHRADAAALRAQLFAYGVGLTAFLTKHMGDWRTSMEILGRVPAGCRRAGRIWSPAEIGGRAPITLVACEMIGMTFGPAAYLRGRRLLRRSAAVLES